MNSLPWAGSRRPTAALAIRGTRSSSWPVPVLSRMDRNTGFAQYGLRNAGELVRIAPSLGMAEFISNSVISGRNRSCVVLMRRNEG